MPKEIPTIAKTYLRFLFHPDYKGKLEHETKGQILTELRSMGLIVEGMLQIPDSVWKEILERTDADTR